MTTVAPRGPDPVLAVLCRCAAVVSGLSVTTLVLFYVVDLRTGADHAFGPLNDVGSVVWHVIAVPVLIGLRPVVSTRPADVVLTAAVLTSLAGAVASALLVVGVASFEASTPVSVAAVLAQSLWLHGWSRRLRGSDWSVRLVRWGFWAPVAQGFGAVAFGVSLLFDWGSVPQLAIMIVGVGPGLVSWLGWPVWFWFTASEVARRGVPETSTHPTSVDEEGDRGRPHPSAHPFQSLVQE